MQNARHAGPVPQQNRPLDSAVPHNHLLVHLPPRLHISDHFVVITQRILVPRHRQIHIHNLELRRHPGSRVRRFPAPPRQPFRQNPGLLPNRRHQPVNPAPVLGALANGVNVLVIPARQAVVNQNPPPHVQPGHPRQIHIRTDARRDDRHITPQRAAILKLQPGYAILPQQPGSLLLQLKRHPGILQPAQQQVARLRIQLLLHQPPHQVNDTDRQPPLHQPRRRLQTQQPASDHRRALRPGAGVLNNLPAVIQRPKDKSPPLVRPLVRNQPVHRRHKRHAPRGDDQLVIGQQQPPGAISRLALPVNPDDAHPRVQLNPVGRVPLRGVDENVLRPVRPRQNPGQQNPVVVAPVLIANHRDVILLLPAQRHHLLNKAGPRHPVADDHQPPLARPGPRPCACRRACTCARACRCSPVHRHTWLPP